MTTIEDKNIPSRRGQHLIQVQLLYSLPFVTTMKKNMTTTRKKLDRIFNTVSPGLLCKNMMTTTTTKDTQSIFKCDLPQGNTGVQSPTIYMYNVHCLPGYSLMGMLHTCKATLKCQKTEITALIGLFTGFKNCVTVTCTHNLLTFFHVSLIVNFVT